MYANTGEKEPVYHYRLTPISSLRPCIRIRRLLFRSRSRVSAAKDSSRISVRHNATFENYLLWRHLSTCRVHNTWKHREKCRRLFVLVLFVVWTGKTIFDPYLFVLKDLWSMTVTTDHSSPPKHGSRSFISRPTNVFNKSRKKQWTRIYIKTLRMFNF